MPLPGPGRTQRRAQPGDGERRGLAGLGRAGGGERAGCRGLGGETCGRAGRGLGARPPFFRAAIHTRVLPALLHPAVRTQCGRAMKERNNALGEGRLVPRQMTDKSSKPLSTPESDAGNVRSLAPSAAFTALNHPQHSSSCPELKEGFSARGRSVGNSAGSFLLSNFPFRSEAKGKVMWSSVISSKRCSQRSHHKICFP